MLSKIKMERIVLQQSIEKSKSTKAKSNCIKDTIYINDGYSGTIQFN